MTTSATAPRTRGVTAITILVLAAAAMLLAVVLLPDRAETDVRFTMADFRLTPASATVPAGEPVTLTFVNEDDVAHDLSFGRMLIATDGRPSSFADDLLTMIARTVEPPSALLVGADGAPVVMVAPGSTVVMRVEFPQDLRGTWEIGCFQSGGCHQIAGIHGALIVE